MNVEEKNEKEIKEWIWFSRLNISSIKKHKLLNKFHNPEQIRKIRREELENIPELNQREKEEIKDIEKQRNIQEDYEYMKKNNIELIHCYEQDYPELLRQIYDFPVSIYVMGNKKCLSGTSIAIIGCRKSSPYGRKIAYEMSYGLSSKHINIVSGLAVGIDTMSHIGSINAKGKTIAIIGSGLDHIYPKENKAMIEPIINLGGAIVSEYCLGTKPLKINFPARNRIISALCSGLLVVEAKQKSGTMITVDFALEHGKNIYAIPGNLTSENSAGTNDLIKQGAKLITSPKEILEEL